MGCIFHFTDLRGPFLADILVGWIDAFYGWVEGLLGEGVSPVLSAILLDGIIGGVGAEVGLPLIMVLFSCWHCLKTVVIWLVVVIMDLSLRKLDCLVDQSSQ